VLIDSCWSFRNGVDSWHTGKVDGNGNGFKLGGNYIATPHTVKNCISFDNAGNGGRGYDENNNTAGQTVYNCTAFRNKGDNFHFLNTVVSGQHAVKNCISYSGNVSITSGVQEQNSWQGFVISDVDFLSLDTTGVTAARLSDGKIPQSTFLHLAPGSTMIDAGVYVGLPYSGKAPDLGAFETTGTTSVTNRPDIVTDFELHQNYPNPFNPSTRLSFTSDRTATVTLKVFDVLGRVVATLFNGTAESGRLYSVEFQAGSIADGMYLAVLDDGTRQAVQKLVLLR
jgi:hypothetical protein